MKKLMSGDDDNCQTYFYSQELTDDFVSVFGNILKAVYLCAGSPKFKTEEELKLACNKALIEILEDNNLDAKSIIFEFTNGKLVLFWNSEWGDVEAVNASIVED